VPLGVAVDDGLARSLFRVLVNEDTAFMPWSALLFVNDFTPDQSTVLADLVEPSWPGYARVSLTPGDWQPVTLSGHQASSQWGAAPIQWTNAGGVAVTVYGYAIYDPAFGQLKLAQRFDPSDVRSIDPGAVVKVVPVYSAGSPCVV